MGSDFGQERYLRVQKGKRIIDKGKQRCQERERLGCQHTARPLLEQFRQSSGMRRHLLSCGARCFSEHLLCVHTPGEFKEQLLGVGFLLPPCGFLGLKVTFVSVGGSGSAEGPPQDGSGLLNSRGSSLRATVLRSSFIVRQKAPSAHQFPHSGKSPKVPGLPTGSRCKGFKKWSKA